MDFIGWKIEPIPTKATAIEEEKTKKEIFETIIMENL